MPDISLKFTLVHSNDWSHADEHRLSSRNKNPPQASPIFPSLPQVLRQHKHISTRQAGVQLDHATTPLEKRTVLGPFGNITTKNPSVACKRQLGIFDSREHFRTHRSHENFWQQDITLKHVDHHSDDSMETVSPPVFVSRSDMNSSTLRRDGYRCPRTFPNICVFIDTKSCPSWTHHSHHDVSIVTGTVSTKDQHMSTQDVHNHDSPMMAGQKGSTNMFGWPANFAALALQAMQS